jgi:hypothetical protein
MTQRADRIVVPGIPVVDHAGARELVIFGLNFIILRPIDQMHDLIDVAVRDALEQFALVRLDDFRRNLFQKVRECHSDALDLLELIGVGPRPARILDFFLSRHHVVEIARQLPARAP